MKLKILIISIIIIASFWLLPEPKKSNENNNTSENKHLLSDNFIISQTRLYDGTLIYEEIDVLIQDNRIAKIGKSISNPNDYPVLNAKGKTLIPGLIDAHTHAYDRALEDALNFGVTTELDMFSMPTFSQQHLPNRDSLNNDKNADLFSSSILATTTNGHGTEYGFEIPVLNRVDEVEEFIQQRIEEGADYIKAVYNSEKATRKSFPSISYEILEQLVKSAHAHDRMLVVHVDNLISAKEAIGIGADGIIHSFMDAVVDAEFVEMMVTNKAFIIPTLSVEASVAQLSNSEYLLNQVKINKYLSKQQRQQLKTSFPDFGIPKEAFQKALDSVLILSKAGVNILAGTDAPNPGTSHGVSIHGELLFLVEAGLSPQQALHSATGAVRKSFAVGQRGSLEVGALASMILLNSNPIDDISNSQDIYQIWKNGKAFERLLPDLESNNNAVIDAGMISDFETSINKTVFGSGIIASTDQMAGGKSFVELIQAKHPSNNNHYLQVKGELIKGFIYLWSGFSFIPGTDSNQAVDLSQISELVFDAKIENPKTALSILIFEKGSYQPKQFNIKLSTSWEKYSVKLSEFKSLDLSEIANISFVVTQELGEFEFMIDNIEMK